MLRVSTTTSIHSCRIRITRNCLSQRRPRKLTPKLVEALRPRLAQAAPEARVFLRELQQGPVQEAAIEVRLTGEDDKVLQYWGNQVEDAAGAHPWLRWTCIATGARMHIG